MNDAIISIGKLRIKGGQWQPIVKFYDCDRQEDAAGQPKELSMADLSTMILNHPQAKILRAKFCKVPLVPFESVALWVEWFRDIGVLGPAVLIHTFVVLQIQFQGGSVLWFSIEKQMDSIVVQQSTNCPDVENFLLGVERKKPVKTLRDADWMVGVSLSALFSILFYLKPEGNVYHLLFRNCQHFAAGVFELATGLPAKDVLSPFIA